MSMTDEDERGGAAQALPPGPQKAAGAPTGAPRVPSATISLPRGRALPLSGTPLAMGIVNVTPDSFSDGGVHFDRAAAIEAVMRMEADGAAVVDIGGESTRPGATAVSIEEEIGRVAAVIEQVRRRSDIPLSIDTRHAAVAEAALASGADMVNDVSALRNDAAMRGVVARHAVPVILMHMRGTPQTMQSLTAYENVVGEVARELAEFRRNAIAAGVAAENILVDPGIGFAKTAEQNLELLARCAELALIGPVVIGASRKSFVGKLTGRDAGPDRAAGSLAAVAAAQRGGAAMVRVHDVRETVDFLRVLAAIEERR